MGIFRLYGDRIIDGLRDVVGGTIDGETIARKVEAEPFHYISQAAGTTFPCMIIEPIRWPNMEWNQEVKWVVCHYEGHIYWVEALANDTTTSVYTRCRRRTEILAERIANTQQLNVIEPVAQEANTETAFLRYVTVGDIDLRSDLQRQLQAAGQQRIAGMFPVDIEVWAVRPLSGEVNTVP